MVFLMCFGAAFHPKRDRFDHNLAHSKKKRKNFYLANSLQRSNIVSILFLTFHIIIYIRIHIREKTFFNNVSRVFFSHWWCGVDCPMFVCCLHDDNIHGLENCLDLWWSAVSDGWFHKPRHNHIIVVVSVVCFCSAWIQH